MNMKKRLPAWLVLCVITLVAGLLLGITNELTKGKIAQQSADAANAARYRVLSEATMLEQMPLEEASGLDNCYAGYDGAGALIGYAAQVTVQGYVGPIEIILGMDAGGNILGVSVGGSGFAETSGLGAKTRDAAFTDQFKGLTVVPGKEIALHEDVDAVSGATISSTAVVDGVNRICAYLTELISREV